MLCFVLTNNGRIWWRNHYANRANEIQELLHDEQRRPSQFMSWFNNCETLLIEKITNLAKYLKLNSKMAVTAFTNWVTYTDNFYQDPIQYWTTMMTCCGKEGRITFFFEDLSKIAIHIMPIPGIEAICERVFSQLKLIHNSLSSKLKNDILDALLTIKIKLIWEKNNTIIFHKKKI